jgi:hypothetical protein
LVVLALISVNLVLLLLRLKKKVYGAVFGERNQVEAIHTHI